MRLPGLTTHRLRLEGEAAGRHDGVSRFEPGEHFNVVANARADGDLADVECAITARDEYHPLTIELLYCDLWNQDLIRELTCAARRELGASEHPRLEFARPVRNIDPHIDRSRRV